jgi:hypothetical protein
MSRTTLLLLSSQTMSALMGGMTIFCLYYAAQVPDHEMVQYLFIDGLKWGTAAAAVVYFQGKYLDGK